MVLPRFSKLLFWHNVRIRHRHRQPFADRSQFRQHKRTDRNLDIVESLLRFAALHGHSLLELGVSWLAAQDAVASVIAGARTPEQAKTNAAAAAWKLTKAELAEVDEIVMQAA